MNYTIITVNQHAEATMKLNCGKGVLMRYGLNLWPQSIQQTKPKRSLSIRTADSLGQGQTDLSYSKVDLSENIIAT